MQIRYGRIGGIVLTGTLVSLLLAPGSAQAAPQEDSLLGIRLLSTFQDVLRKFKQPSEIQIGEPTTPSQGPTIQGAPGQAGPGGNPYRGMGGPPGMPGMPGRPYSMPPGVPYGGGPGGNPYRGMGGGPPGMMRRGGMPGMPYGGAPGMPYGGRPSGLPGFAGGTGGPQGMPGYPGPPGGMNGGPGYPGYPGGPQGMPGLPGGLPGSGTAAPEETAPAETTWWYKFPNKNVYYSFLFNKEGRVIQIQEYGLKGTYTTHQGIGLGSSLGQIIQRYGWSNNGSPNDEDLILRYGSRHQLAFQLVKNKVVGITLGLVR